LNKEQKEYGLYLYEYPVDLYHKGGLRGRRIYMIKKDILETWKHPPSYGYEKIYEVLTDRSLSYTYSEIQNFLQNATELI
jgi:hypothetical protein